MPLSLRRGKVTAVTEQHEGLVRCEVEGEPCIAYPDLTGAVAVGDDVIVNVLRVAYVQLAGGALPIGLSDTVRALRARELIGTTLSAGSCFGADLECVTVASALAWSAGEELDAVVCSIGPGIVGTSSRLGHGGLAAAEAANSATALGGSSVLAVRASSGDKRARHRGVSHHTRAVFELCLGEVSVAWPAGLEAPDWLDRRRELDVSEWRAACDGLPLDHMGRGPDDDPWFFASAFAAGKLGRTLIR